METKPFRYDAFISYSHAKDRALAKALQGVIQTLGRPWYRRPVLRVFRDESSLSASPSLWPSIEQALAESGRFILLACPEAAASKWVSREVEWWRANRSDGDILLALTDGDLTWDPEAWDFEYGPRAALPEALKGAFRDEPLWVDFRGRRDARGKAKADRNFVAAAAGLVSAIRGVPKDALISEELRQQRRAVAQASGAAIVMAVLFVAACFAAVEAVKAQRLAEDQGRLAARSLDEATQTAANLVQDLTNKYSLSSGPAAPVIGDILERIGALEHELRATVGKNQHTELIFAANIAVRAVAMRGKDNKKALELMTEANDVFKGLLVSDPHNFNILHQTIGTDALIGKIEMDLGNGAALSDFQKAKTLAVGEVEDDPKNGTAQADLYNSYKDIGDFHEWYKNYDDAIASYETAITEITDQIKLYPLDRNLQFDLSAMYKLLGDVYLDKNDGGKILEEWGKSIDILTKLHKRLPDDAGVTDRLGIYLVALGLTKDRNLKDHNGAEEAFLSAQELLGKVSTQDGPDKIKWLKDAAWASDSLGRLASRGGDLKLAADSFEKQADAYRRLVALDPEVKESQYELEVAYILLAKTCQKLGQTQKARGALDLGQAVATKLVAEHPDYATAKKDLDWFNRTIADLNKQ